MALFSGLSEKLGHVFSKLTNRGRLTELEVKEAMRSGRQLSCCKRFYCQNK